MAEFWQIMLITAISAGWQTKVAKASNSLGSGNAASAQKLVELADMKLSWDIDGAPGPGEHRLDVEADMMTMRSYHQTRMRVPAILAVLAMILVFAGCGGRVVSVACDAGVQYGNLSDAVAASDSHRCHD